MPDEPYEFLRSVQLFTDVSDKDLQTIAVSMRRRAFAPGERIVAEGEGGVGFFFVETGTASVTQDGERRATLGPGDHFGELALISERERSATVTAKTEVRALEIPFWDFRDFAHANPDVTWKLLQHVVALIQPA